MFPDIHDINRSPTSAVQPGGGIDYLELVLPDSVRFTPQFEASRRHARIRLNSEDLGFAGWPLVLKHPPFRGRRGSALRTIRIDKVNRKNRTGIVSLLTDALLDFDPLSLTVRRVDFAVDLVDGPTVEHFRQTTRVRLKRKGREYVTQSPGDGGFAKLCHQWGTVQTISLGDVKSDCFKIYDKAVQSRETDPSLPPHDFLLRAWVRIERLLIGAKIPAQISTLDTLLTNASAFDPFHDVEIARYAEITPSRILLATHLSEMQKMNALYVSALVDEFGRAEAVRRLRLKHKRKLREMLAWFDSVGNSSIQMPTRETLTVAYQTACRNQLSASFYNNNNSRCNLYLTQSI